jgi:Raf kinase inhibitor-like YbhB/YbcL family protein
MKFMKKRFVFIISLVILTQSISLPSSFAKKKKKITLTSTAFINNGILPEKYTCEGDNVSPPLRWEGVPEKAKSIAITLDDPDAPKTRFTHWVIFNIPPEISELAENIPDDPTLEDGTVQGNNDFGLIGYDGPCPPSGSPHRYTFQIFALKKELNLKPGATKKQVLRKLRKKILARGKLIGVYER